MPQVARVVGKRKPGKPIPDAQRRTTRVTVHLPPDVAAELRRRGVEHPRRHHRVGRLARRARARGRAVTPRAVALYRERAELQRQLARVDAALADEAEGAANDTVTELDRRRADVDARKIVASSVAPCAGTTSATPARAPSSLGCGDARGPLRKSARC